MWRKVSILGLSILALLLTTDDTENVPRSMEPDLTLSYKIDKHTNINFGVRTPSELEYIANRQKYINQYILWLSIDF